MTRRPRGPRPPDQGAVTISLAILFPTVLAVLLLVVQASIWWYADQVALTAAREGVDAGRSRDSRPGDAQARVREFLASFGTMAELDTVQDGSDGTTERLTVRVRTQSVLPVVFDHLRIEQTASAPKEKFVPQGGTP